MPKITASETEVVVKRLSKEKYSYSQIKQKLKVENVDISISTICRILNNVSISRQAAFSNEPKPKNSTKPAKRNEEKSKKLEN